MIRLLTGFMAEIAGIGPVRVKRIVTGWAEQKIIREIRPMSITWKLEVPLPADMFRSFGVLRGA